MYQSGYEQGNVRRKGRLTKFAGLTLIAVGLALLAGVGAFYGLGIYSSTQLDKLNAEIEGPVALPDDTIIHGAILEDGTFAGVTQITDPDVLSQFQPVTEKPKPSTAKNTPPSPSEVTQPSTASSSGAASSTTENAPANDAANVQSPAAGSFPIEQFASLYPGAAMHPKYWGQPMWAGTDPYPLTKPSRPDGFIPMSASDESLNVKRPDARRIVIPSIGVDSKISELGIINLGDSRAYQTPDNVVGHIPNTSNPGEAGNGWFFGHLESPLRGEGNVFGRLPEIPKKVTNGEPVYISIVSDDGEYLYQVVASRVMHENELQLYDTDDSTITLVTCANRPHYDQRQLVTAKLVGIRPL